MHILITGGAGFIGSNLARMALLCRHKVTIIDDLSTGYVENLTGLDVRLIQASILDTGALNDALSGTDSVVHLAALGSVPRSIIDPMRSHRVNASGTLQVLEAARANEVKHVVFASSSSVYGKNPALPKGEREWVRPLSPYAVSKLAAEQYVLAYQESYGLASTAFRFFNVYGPGQRAGHTYAAVIPIFLDSLLRGQPLPVNGSGEQSRDFTFVETVCAVLLSAVECRSSHGEPVNLAFGTNTTLLQLIDRMRHVTGMEVEITHRKPRVGDVPHSQADNASLRKLFPAIEPVVLDAGLKRTWEWLEKNQTLEPSEPHTSQVG